MPHLLKLHSVCKKRMESGPDVEANRCGCNLLLLALQRMSLPYPQIPREGREVAGGVDCSCGDGMLRHI